MYAEDQRFTAIELKILDIFRRKRSNIISPLDLIKGVGSSGSAITGLLSKGIVERTTIDSMHFYRLKNAEVLEDDRPSPQPIKPSLSPIYLPQTNAIDRHLRRWGKCSIETDLRNWNFDTPPIYTMLEGKNR